MDLDIRETGATIIIGLFSLIILALLVQISFGGVLAYWRAVSGALGTVALPAVIGLLAFGTGLIIEDLSNNLVDDHVAASWSFLEPESTVRARALFGTDPKKPHALALDSARLRLLSEHAGANGRAIEDSLLISGSFAKQLRKDQLNTDMLEHAADALYYQAKNSSYQHPSYFTELQAIQTRIDFSRSISTLSLYSIIAIAMVFGVQATVALLMGAIRTVNRIPSVIHARPRPRSLVRPIWNILKAEVKGAMIWHVEPLHLVVFCSAIALISWLGAKAYAFEEIEFDKRVFGYYRTLEGSKPKCSLSQTGYSGMASVGENTYLVVHDSKDVEATVWASILTVEPNLPPFETPLKIKWPTTSPIPNDLEAVCRIPGQSKFVLVESGADSDGTRVPRAFIIALSQAPPWEATVENVIYIRASEAIGEIEGVVCAEWNGKLVLLVAERGSENGSMEPTAFAASTTVRWGELLVDEAYCQMADKGRIEVKSDAIQTRGPIRACSDLFLDKDGALWSVATIDPAGRDDGPFTSVIYRAGDVSKNGTERPFEFTAASKPERILAGVKVEGLAGPPIAKDMITRFTVATDDEVYSGIWRKIE